jgi:predicted Zn-dependent protease
LALLQLFSSCASAPPPRKPTVTERIEFNRAIGTELAQQLAPQLTFKKDAQVQAYLGKVAQRLAAKNAELHLTDVKVFLLKDTDRRYRSYGLPGGRLYLSSARLKTLEFESEVAAMMAIELGHLLNEHVQNYLRKSPAGLQVQDAAAMPAVLPLKTLEAPEDIDFLGKDGMFAFSAKDNDEAIASAVNILYDAGYDPRGLITYLKRLNDNPAHSPWDESELSRIMDQARKNVALLTPLRNPIVQTDDFELIRAKLQKL